MPGISSTFKDEFKSNLTLTRCVVITPNVLLHLDFIPKTTQYLGLNRNKGNYFCKIKTNISKYEKCTA